MDSRPTFGVRSVRREVGTCGADQLHSEVVSAPSDTFELRRSRAAPEKCSALLKSPASGTHTRSPVSYRPVSASAANMFNNLAIGCTPSCWQVGRLFPGHLSTRAGKQTSAQERGRTQRVTPARAGRPACDGADVSVVRTTAARAGKTDREGRHREMERTTPARAGTIRASLAELVVLPRGGA